MKIDQSIELVKSYLVKGEYGRVISLGQKVLQQQPNLPIIYHILGQALAAEGAIEAAQNAYLRAVDLQPDFLDARVYLAELYSENDRLDEAIVHYQEALKLCPTEAILYHNLGLVFFRLARLPEAIQAYKKAIELKPDYDRAYFNLALSFNAYEDYPRAILAYEDVIKRANSLSYKLDAYNNLGALFLRLDRREEAISIFHKGIELKPDSATFYNNLGQALWYDDKDGAIQAFQRAIECDPNMVLAHYNLGKARQFQGFYQVSIPCFQKVIELDSSHRGAYTDCGFSYLMMGKFEEAFIYLQKVLALQSDFIAAYCENARFLKGDDELTLAQRSCSQFLEILLGSSLTQKVNHNHEKVGFTSRSLLDPLPPLDREKLIYYVSQAYIHLGNALLEYGSYEHAENYYRQALHFSVKSPEVYIKLAYCLAQEKRYYSAMIVYQLALKIEPDLSLSLEIGKLLEKQGQWEKAIEFYQQVLRKNQSKIFLNKGLPTLSLDAIDTPKKVYKKTLDWLVENNLARENYVLIREKKEENLPQSDSFSRSSWRDKPYECGGLTCAICLWEMRQWFKPIHLGWNLYSCFTEEKIPLHNPPTNFVATIPQGKAWIVPQENYWKLCKAMAVMTPDNHFLADLSRDYPGQLPVCKKDDPREHTIFKIDRFPPLESRDETVAILSGLSGNVYFHWMVDVLPRIELLRQGGFNLEEIDKFVVNGYQQPFQRKTLEWLGIPEEKILESDRHPYIQAKKLICPSFPGDLGWPSPWIIDFLRREFLGKMAIKRESDYPQRIYISRSQARYRKVFNEPEVMDVLKGGGFVSICLESLSLEEQIALFYHAKVVITPHGSGLTNIIFCQPGTKIIEFMSPHYISHYYWGISNILNLQHYYLVGETIDCYVLRDLMYQSHLTEDMLINLKLLKKMLKMLGL